MKDARWFGVGLVALAAVLDGCGADHVVGSGTSGAGTTGGAGVAGSGAGSDGARGGTGGNADGGTGLVEGGTGGTSGGRGGTSGAGGAAMAGIGGNGGSSAGSAGTAGASGAGAGGVLGSGGGAGSTLGGSGGSPGGEGGTGGEGGGAGPTPIQCASPTVRGTLTDSTGSTNTQGFQGPATITSINHSDPGSSSVEFVLQASDDSEWHYDVTLPCLYMGPLPVGATPELGVQVGDSVEVKLVNPAMSNFFSEHQAIVMLHDGALVLFTVDEAEVGTPSPIDLSEFGFDVRIEPTTTGTPSFCATASGLKDAFERLVVTKDSETAVVEASQTVLLGGFTFSVEQMSHVNGSTGCDPPGWSRYGGFLMQP